MLDYSFLYSLNSVLNRAKIQYAEKEQNSWAYLSLSVAFSPDVNLSFDQLSYAIFRDLRRDHGNSGVGNSCCLLSLSSTSKQPVFYMFFL